MSRYGRKQWREFRDEVIRLDGGRCRACGRSETDGVALQVHHTHYVPGRQPWEYPYEECHTLCRGCHAREHGHIRPAAGWQYVGDHDLEDLIGTCDLCGTSIRYVFFIQHEKWPTPMEVGTDCCDNLTCTTTASSHMESIRRYNDRCKRFAGSSRWRRDGTGAWHIVQAKLNVSVLVEGVQYRLRIDGVLGKKTFATLVDAKRRAFAVIEDGSARTYVEKHARRARPKRRTR